MEVETNVVAMGGWKMAESTNINQFQRVKDVKKIAKFKHKILRLVDEDLSSRKEVRRFKCKYSWQLQGQEDLASEIQDNQMKKQQPMT